MELFQQRGYAATTVEDIADAAAVSVRTLYRYFPSKEALLFARLDAALDAVLAAMRDRDRTLPMLRSLQLSVGGAADTMEDIGEVLKVLWLLAAQDSSLESLGVKPVMRWRNAFTSEIASQVELPVNDQRVHVVAAALHGAVTAGVAQWRGSGGQGPLADAVRDALELLGDLPAAAAALEASAKRRPPAKRP